MRVQNDSQVQTPAVQETPTPDPVREGGTAGRTQGGEAKDTVERFDDLGGLFGVGDASPSILSGLGALASMIFDKGVDKAALGEGASAALGQVPGATPDLLAFGLKAIGMILAEPTPEGLIKTGIKLAQDPNFGVVLSRLFEVATQLVAEAA